MPFLVVDLKFLFGLSIALVFDCQCKQRGVSSGTMVVCLKTKDRREVLNLKSSINCGDDCEASQHRKGKGCSVECLLWVLGLLGF
jgi:hypothetical protein